MSLYVFLLHLHSPVNTAGQSVRPLLVQWLWYMCFCMHAVHVCHALSCMRCCVLFDMLLNDMLLFDVTAGVRLHISHLPKKIQLSGSLPPSSFWEGAVADDFQSSAPLTAASVHRRTLKRASNRILLHVCKSFPHAGLRGCLLFS